MILGHKVTLDLDHCLHGQDAQVKTQSVECNH